MVNKVILVGNVGADPEIRHINEDTQVASFTMATSESYKNREGERVTQTVWHNIVVWRGLSKIVEQFVKKGSQIYIEGKLTTNSYEKDGIKRYSTQIVASDIKLLGSKQESSHTQAKNNEPEIKHDDNGDDDADDLPF